MKRSGLRGVSFNRKHCCGSDKARRDRLLVPSPASRQALGYHSTFRAVGVCLVGWVLSTVIGVVLLLFVAP